MSLDRLRRQAQFGLNVSDLKFVFSDKLCHVSPQSPRGETWLCMHGPIFDILIAGEEKFLLLDENLAQNLLAKAEKQGIIVLVNTNQN